MACASYPSASRRACHLRERPEPWPWTSASRGSDQCLFLGRNVGSSFGVGGGIQERESGFKRREVHRWNQFVIVSAGVKGNDYARLAASGQSGIAVSDGYSAVAQPLAPAASAFNSPTFDLIIHSSDNDRRFGISETAESNHFHNNAAETRVQLFCLVQWERIASADAVGHETALATVGAEIPPVFLQRVSFFFHGLNIPNCWVLSTGKERKFDAL